MIPGIYDVTPNNQIRADYIQVNHLHQHLCILISADQNGNDVVDNYFKKYFE